MDLKMDSEKMDKQSDSSQSSIDDESDSQSLESDDVEENCEEVSNNIKPSEVNRKSRRKLTVGSRTNSIPDKVEVECMESLGEADPLFYLLIPSSDADSVVNMHLEEGKRADSSSSSKSQIDIKSGNIEHTKVVKYSESDETVSIADKKKSFGNALKDMKQQVRSQLSLTNLKYLQKKNTKKLKSTLKSITGSFVDNTHNKHHNEYPRHPVMKMYPDQDLMDIDEVVKTPVEIFEWNPAGHKDLKFMNQIAYENYTNEVTEKGDGMITFLPDWLSSPAVNKKHIKELLISTIEEKCNLAKLERHDVWEISVSKNGPRDYRKIFIYISGKIEMPKDIYCMSYSSKDDTLIIGGEKGMLKALEVEHFNAFTKTRNPDLKDVSYKVKKHETIVGHLFDVKDINWHSVGDRFMTFDKMGVILGFLRVNEETRSWAPDMVQDKVQSTVLKLAWSPDCSKVCFLYQDVDEQENTRYGIVMGASDGSRLWANDLSSGIFHPFGIHWMDNNKFAILHDGNILIIHQNGLVMRKEPLKIEEIHDLGQPIAFLGRPSTSCTNTGTFSLAIVWEWNRITLCEDFMSSHGLKESVGERYLNVNTHLQASCADWSPNGLFIAVGGRPPREILSQVNIHNYSGKLLTVVRVDEPTISCISWDMDSFHLAIGAENILYLGSVRPVYKFAATSNGSLFAYAFACDDDNYIGLWDTKKLSVEKVPGKVVDLKSHEERFALLSVNDEGVFCASILNKLGIPIDSLVILTMEPFTLCLSDSCLVCLSATSIIFWRYRDSFAQGISSARSDKSRYMRQIHIDDQSTLIPTFCEIEHERDPFKAISDPAKCMDVKMSTLCIGRRSGKLQFYCLPQGGLMYTVEMEKCTPYLLMFNPLADRLAILDINGSLRYGLVNDFQVEISPTDVSSEVLNLIWAKDMPYHLCVMERTKMCILRDGDLFEEFENIHALLGYLAGFDNLQVTLLRLDEILDDPYHPKAEHVITIDMKVIKFAQSFFEYGINKGDFSELNKNIDKINQPRLWNIVGKGFLVRGEISLAEHAFVKARNYPAIQLIQRLEEIDMVKLKKAEIYAFFEDFEKAEEYYLKAGRTDLAVKMWNDLNEKSKANAILEGHVENYDCIESQGIADKLFHSGDLRAALKHYKDLNNTSRMFECYVRLEDYQGLKTLAENLPQGDPLLAKIATIFATIGLTTESVAIWLAFGSPEIAINTALDNFQWNLALEASRNYNIPIVAQVLLKRTGQLINSGNVMQAVQFLKVCNKTFAAGKLLAMMAKTELQEKEQLNIESVKKLFVMAAMMFCSKPNRALLTTNTRMNNVSEIQLEDDIDFKLSYCIPDAMKPTFSDMKWMRETPWRGAHAMQFLIITQKHIHNGHYTKATKVAMYLRTFIDILGEERVNCLLALSAAAGENFNVCSGALMKLEKIDQEYCEIAFQLFRNQERVDKHDIRVECQTCATKLDFNSVCPTCSYRPPVCILTGEILTLAASIWTCQICGGTADSRKCKRFHYCPLCHGPKS